MKMSMCISFRFFIASNFCTVGLPLDLVSLTLHKQNKYCQNELFVPR